MSDDRVPPGQRVTLHEALREYEEVLREELSLDLRRGREVAVAGDEIELANIRALRLHFFGEDV